MPANIERGTPLHVGEREAMDLLLEKIRAFRSAFDEDRKERLLRAVEHLERGDRAGEAFQHGLLTGYSVAMQLLAQQMEEGEE